MAEGGTPTPYLVMPTSTAPLISPMQNEEGQLSPSPSAASLHSLSSNQDPGNTELHFACMQFDKKLASELLSSGHSVSRTNNEERSCFHEMVLKYLSMNMTDQADHFKKFVDIIKLLVERGLNVNMGDLKFQTPLHYVVRHPNNHKVIHTLKSCGVRVNAEDRANQTSLHLAVPLANLENIKALLDAGADPNQADGVGKVALHLAAKGLHHTEVIRTLILCGAQTDVTDHTNRTPLHVAAKFGRHDTIKLLLEAGAHIMARDSSGMTALHVAAGNDMTGLSCSTLIKWGEATKRETKFDINSIDNIYQETALHRAVRMQMSQNMELLLAGGASVAVQDALGDSVLHKAITLRNIAAWKQLMDSGHKHGYLQNKCGYTPFQLAFKADNYIAVNMMRQYRLYDY